MGREIKFRGKEIELKQARLDKQTYAERLHDNFNLEKEIYQTKLYKGFLEELRGEK